jgi:hypothetical protein
VFGAHDTAWILHRTATRTYEVQAAIDSAELYRRQVALIIQMVAATIPQAGCTTQQRRPILDAGLLSCMACTDPPRSLAKAYKMIDIPNSGIWNIYGAQATRPAGAV